MTDRKLSSDTRKSPLRRKNSRQLSRKEQFSKSSASQSSSSKKKLSGGSSVSDLLPLFSQPSNNHDDKVTVSAREDSLLLQIRRDINGMVEIPTQSSSKTVAESKKSLKKMKSVTPTISDINGSSKTTTNRLFSNNLIKGSLERIIYLWSTRISDDFSTYTSRYIPEIVDILYPLYLTNLHGYVWDNHISTTLGEKKNVKRVTDKKARSTFLGIDVYSENIKVDDFDFDEVNLSTSEPIIYEDKDRQSRLKRCEDLAVGVGIDSIPEEILEEVEADTYWCLENFMLAVQDYRYNHAFSGDPLTASKQKANGVQNMIALLEKVVQRVDPILYKHIKSNGVGKFYGEN